MNLPPPVLVVEDDPEIARALRRELATHSVASKLAKNVEETAGLSDTFSVAIIDINLPDGNGLDVYEELLEKRKVFSAVFFSASAESDDLKRAKELGKLVSKSAGVPAAVKAALTLNTLRPPQSGMRPSSPESCASDEQPTGTNKT